MISTTASANAARLTRQSAVRSRIVHSNVSVQRRAISQSSSSSSSSTTAWKASPHTSRRFVGGAVSALAAAASISYFASPISNEAAQAPPSSADDIVTPTIVSQQDQMRERARQQGVYAWGSNRYNVVAPDAPMITLVKTARSIPFFSGMALRDIVMEEKHGVAVDAHGDVLQWGLGFFDATSRAVIDNIEEAPLGRRREKERANELSPRGSDAARPRDPVKTLVGKDIVRVAASDEKIYALSRKGDVYVFSAIQKRQVPPSGQGKPWSANPLSLFGTFSARQIDHEKLKLAPSAGLSSRDRVAEIQAGSNHLTALTKEGRVLALPIDDKGNAFGQLGFRRVLLNSPATPDSKATQIETILEPRLLAQMTNPEEPPNATLMPSSQLPPSPPVSNTTSKPQPQAVGTPTDPPPSPTPLTEPPSSIRYCTTLSEIPSLRQVDVAQIALGNEHCLARTSDGRVLAWGRHTHGQLGLGVNFSIECIPVPSEVVLVRCFPPSSRDVRCTSLAAGGDNSFFVTERREEGRMGTGKSIDVLAAGKGQWGTLGNAMWSQVKPDPTRVKTVSGLMEYSERSNATHPVPIHTISVGRPGHVALVLDTVETEGHVAFGRDVMVFGHNAAYQLGTGKRSNLSVPQHLHPLPPPTPVAGAPAPEPAVPSKEQKKLVEQDINSGALTHMPHNRLQLASQSRGTTHGSPPTTVSTVGSQQAQGQAQGNSNAESSPSPSTSTQAAKKGKQKKTDVEETISAGTVSMAIWWKCQ